MSLKNYLIASKIALGNIFSKPSTVMFPKEMVVTVEGYRGTPVVIPETCTLCRACERVCPTKAINITPLEGDKYNFLIDLGPCCYCGECEASCRFDSIHLKNVWMTSEMDKEKLKRIETVIKRRKK